MKTPKLVILVPILLTLSGCVGGGKTFLAADEDEDYGIGGTGLVAQNNVSEGIGVIGKITGFGSIFVNGIEVEDDDATIISVNGRKVTSHEFEIGEVVEVLTRDEQLLTGAVLINVRHEVIGPVSKIDRTGDRLTILNQNVLVEDLPANIETGTFLAISGFRDGEGQIHATHVAITRPGRVLLRGRLDRSQNGLSMYGFELVFPEQPQAENNEFKVEGILAEGKVNVIRAFPTSVANFKNVFTWVVQGFPETYASTWKDNEGLKKISDQSKPVIFRVGYVDQNKPAKVMLLPANLPKGSQNNTGHKNSKPGNQSSPGQDGNDSSGRGSNSGGNGDGTGKSGTSSSGGSKP